MKVGFSEADLGAETKFTINYLSNLECNRKGASLSTLETIAKVYGIPPSFIMVLAEPDEGIFPELISYMKSEVRSYLKEKFNY